MRLDFACGCFWIVGTALSCCATHEAPHQTVEAILPLTLVSVRQRAQQEGE